MKVFKVKDTEEYVLMFIEGRAFGEFKELNLVMDIKGNYKAMMDDQLEFVEELDEQ